jgi:hypothetical protein
VYAGVGDNGGSNRWNAQTADRHRRVPGKRERCALHRRLSRTGALSGADHR